MRAIRDANIDVYVDALSYWAVWFFLFDHPNYARYTTVHLVDLWNAKRENSDVYWALHNARVFYYSIHSQDVTQLLRLLVSERLVFTNLG